MQRSKYKHREIVDREVSGDNKYILKDASNGRTELVPAPDLVKEEGTKLNADLLNHVDDFLVTLTDEEGHLVDRGDMVAVVGDVEYVVDMVDEKYTNVNTKIITETNKIRDELDTEAYKIRNELGTETSKLTTNLSQTNDEVDTLIKRVNNLTDSIPGFILLQIRSLNVCICEDEDVAPLWDTVENSHPNVMEMVDNRLVVHQEGLVSFNTTIEISEPRLEAVTLNLETRNGEVLNQRSVYIPAGTEPFTQTVHLEMLNVTNFALYISTSKQISLDRIETIARFSGHLESDTNNVSLTNPELEAGAATITNQSDLNRQTLRNANELRTDVDANHEWANTQIQHLSATRPANGDSAIFNNLGVAGELHLQRNNETSLRIGDDAFIGDANIANGFRVSGQQNPDQGVIQFGNGARIQNDTPSDLSINGNLILTGNIAASNLITQPWSQTWATPANNGASSFTFGQLENHSIPQGVRAFYLIFRNGQAQEHFCLIPINFRANEIFTSRVVEMRRWDVGNAQYHRFTFLVDNMNYNFANGTFTIRIGQSGRNYQTSWTARSLLSLGIHVELRAI